MKKTFIFLLALIFARQTFSYGPTGHEIVGGIADKLLANTATAARLNALLDGISLEKAATIPDEIKGWDAKGADNMRVYPRYRDYPRIEAQLRDFWRANPPTEDPRSAVPSHHWFHYTDVPVLNSEKYADGKVGRNQWDIVHMMHYSTDVLLGKTPEDNPRKITKPVAVILLAHLVGDIHQPLHVGAEYFGQNGQKVDPDRGQAGLEDQGGNSLKLELFGGTNRRSIKLHGFWDNDAVLAQLPSLPAGLTKKEQMAQIEGPKKQLIDRLAKEEPKQWKLPTSVALDDYGEAWANEILPIARQANERLRFTNVHAVQEYEQTIAEGLASEQSISDHISYRDWSTRIVAEELHKAGWRLADLFGKILSSSASTIASISPTPTVREPTPAASPSVTATPLASAVPSATPLPSPVRADAIYGEYPMKYKDIIMDWLYLHLHDPISAKIEWQSEPKRADLPGPGGRKLYGYLVLFTINARNQFGTYTGKQTHGALIRNGEVIKTIGFGY